MYTPSRAAANAYANVGLESGVLSASPHKLIIMLYEGAELAVRMAIRYIREGDIPKKTAAINKANGIIVEGLMSALDTKQGGDIAVQLASLYDYMTKRLMLAHINNQTEPLEEVLGLLRELHDAWQQIGNQGQAQSSSFQHPIAA